MGKTKLISWLKSNWVLVVLLLIGAFFRLYKIDEYMTFLGDEGRDSIIVRNLLVNADPILIGPGTSVGGMYLGPLYYYFMAPFLFLANFSPVGPAVGVALFGVATIYLVYIAGKEWFSKTAGLIAAGLFSISPTAITFSHSSWNPNIMPFFSMLSVYSIWKVWKHQEYKWLIVCAVAFAFVLQSHYLGLLLAPALFVFWLLSKVTWKYTLIAMLSFGFLMSPLLIFDIRHDWMNSRALYKFLTVREETVSIQPWPAIPKTYPIFEQINGSMLTAKNVEFARIITVLMIVWLVFFLRKSKSSGQYYLILIWLVTGLIGFGLYKQSIYDHYFGFLFPVPFLLLGAMISNRFELKNKFLNFTLCLIVLALVFTNLKNNPFMYHSNKQLQRSKEVANKVIEISGNKPFNLAVLAERNYEDGYRYFLDVNGSVVLHADRWDKNTIADTLIVICEMEKQKCDPTHSPKAEVANFGWSKIDSEYEIGGVIIYKLLHSK